MRERIQCQTPFAFGSLVPFPFANQSVAEFVDGQRKNNRQNPNDGDGRAELEKLKKHAPYDTCLAKNRRP